jgi:hypothetical protein
MVQITGKKPFFIYKLELKPKIDKKKKSEMEYLVEALNKHKLSTFSDPSQKGFVAYQFDSALSNENSNPIESSFVEKILVIKFVEYHVKGERAKISDQLKTMMENPDIPASAKFEMKKLLQIIVPDYQDFIFLPDNSIMLVFPSTDESRTIMNRLLPYIEEKFDISPNNASHNIDEDALAWLVFKICRGKKGNLGSMKITHLEGISSTAYRHTGILDINDIEDAGDTIYAKIAYGFLNEPLRRINLTMEYDGGQYHFSLLPQGGFIFEPSKFLTYDSGNPRSNKILMLRDICQSIIPHIYQEYFKDKPNWDKERPVIQDQLLAEAKEKIRSI